MHRLVTGDGTMCFSEGTGSHHPTSGMDDELQITKVLLQKRPSNGARAQCMCFEMTALQVGKSPADVVLDCHTWASSQQ